MAISEVLLNDVSHRVLRKLLMNCNLFDTHPELLATPYSVKSSVSPDVLQLFLDALQGNAIEITHRNHTELDQLSTEFGFAPLSEQLAKFDSTSGQTGGLRLLEGEVHSLQERVLSQEAVIECLHGLGARISEIESSLSALESSFNKRLTALNSAFEARLSSTESSLTSVVASSVSSTVEPALVSLRKDDRLVRGYVARLRDAFGEAGPAPPWTPEGDILAALRPPVMQEKDLITDRADYNTLRVVMRARIWNVSLVRHNTSGRVCALKQVEPAAGRLDRMRLQRLRHPALVGVVGIADGAPESLFAEWCSRGSLASVTEVPPTVRAKIAVGAALAVAHLHRCGVAHGGITRGRMLLDGSWEVKVDGPFWIKEQERATMEKSVFMAPEVLSTGPSLPGDVYAFGILLWELVKGGRWQGGERRPDLKGFSPWLKRLLAEMWGEDPQTRPRMENVIKVMEGQKWAVVDGADSTKVVEYVARVRSAEASCPVQPL
jgi:hypothetical protein